MQNFSISTSKKSLKSIAPKHTRKNTPKVALPWVSLEESVSNIVRATLFLRENNAKLILFCFIRSKCLRSVESVSGSHHVVWKRISRILYYRCYNVLNIDENQTLLFSVIPDFRCHLMQDLSIQMIPLFVHEYFNVSVSLKFLKKKPSKQTGKKLRHLIHMIFRFGFSVFSTIDIFTTIVEVLTHVRLTMTIRRCWT